MEIKEFQAKLSEALGLAVENGKKIHADTVEGIFAGNGLTEGQMQKVYEYLAIQGIQVDGRGPGSAAADGQTGSEAPVTTAAGIPADSEAVPLTQEETEYLNNEIGKNKLSEYTANIAFAGFTAPKILWMKKNEPANLPASQRSCCQRITLHIVCQVLSAQTFPMLPECFFWMLRTAAGQRK